MKNRKVIISLIIVLVIILLIIFYFLLIKPNKKAEETEEVYGILEKFAVDLDKIDSIKGDYVIGYKGEKIGVVDKEGNEIIPFEYDSNKGIDDENYFVLCKNNNCYLIRNTGDVERNLESSRLVQDYGKGTYYLEKNNVLYDIKSNIIYNAPSRLVGIYDGKAIYSSSLFDIEKGKSEDIELIDDEEEYLLYKKGNKYYLYLVEENKWGEYKDYESNSVGTYLYDDSGYIILTEDNKIINNGRKELFKGYYLDYTGCSGGFILKDKSGKNVTDICYNKYNFVANDKVVVVSNSSRKDILFNNGELVTNYNRTYNDIEDYIVLIENGKYNAYDANHKKMSTGCNNSHLYSGFNKGSMICDDYIDYYVVDSDFKKISDPYDNIECNDNKLCIIEKNDLYGLFYNGEVIVEPIYYDIEISDRYIIASKIEHYDVLVFGIGENYLTKDQITVVDDNYKSIDVNDVIKKYGLEDIKKEIYENEDLFKKYAYYVINNDNIGEYKKHMLRLFRVVALNKKNLSESYLLKSLTELEIQRVSSVNYSSAVGLYQDISTKVSLDKEDANTRVAYHELMHFIDYRINKDDDYNDYICKLDNKYYARDDLRKLSIDERNNCSNVAIKKSTLLIEAGAEINSARYVMNNLIETYTTGVNIYNALVYLYGEGKMNDVFFGKNTNESLMMMLLDNLTIDEYKDFITSTDNLTNITSSASSTSASKVIKYLIDIYKEKKGDNWAGDKKFMFILTNIKNEFTLDSSVLDSNIIAKIGDNNAIINKMYDYMKKNSGIEYEFRIYPPSTLTNNGADYVLCITSYGHGDAFRRGYLIVDYDYANEKVNNYAFSRFEE
jgi:hypothetical protein